MDGILLAATLPAEDGALVVADTLEAEEGADEVGLDDERMDVELLDVDMVDEAEMEAFETDDTLEGSWTVTFGNVVEAV